MQDASLVRIFISYRRNDATAHALHILDELLVLGFDKEEIFLDQSQPRYGVPFPQEIMEALQASHILLAVIGPRWLGQEGSSRRIDNPNDWVRKEVETALERNIAVIPVLVADANMPSEEELPPTLSVLPKLLVPLTLEKVNTGTDWAIWAKSWSELLATQLISMP